jgi:hypothetical protein
LSGFGLKLAHAQLRRCQYRDHSVAGDARGEAPVATLSERIATKQQVAAFHSANLRRVVRRLFWTLVCLMAQSFWFSLYI